jgi:hypothetical protein
MKEILLDRNSVEPGMYVQSVLTDWIYVVCENIDLIRPTHRVNGDELIEHFFDSEYSMSEDDINICETIFTRKLNKHIYREKILNELGI